MPHRALDLDGYFERQRQWKMIIRFGTCKVRSLYRAGSVKPVACKLAKHYLQLVAIQEVRGDKGGSQPAVDYTFFCGNENANHHLGLGSLIHKEIISTVKMI
jgi:hypothetical protein